MPVCWRSGGPLQRAARAMEALCSVPVHVMRDIALLNCLAEAAKDFAFHRGIAMRTPENPNESERVLFVPFTLFPSVVPTVLFEQAMEVQRDFNLLIDRVSQDHAFLQETLKSTVDSDEFSANVFRIFQRLLDENITKPVVLGLNRSDYMFDLHADGASSSLKQIETNTFAASFGGLSCSTPDLHRHVLRLLGKPGEGVEVPSNSPAEELGRGIAVAWELYGEPKAAVMFLVETDCRNIFDQRCVEYALWKRGIKVLRKTFGDVTKQASLLPDRTLHVNGTEIAVVYYRSGYTPNNYSGPKDWEARELLDRSRAITCPDIATHLAGTKKVQQVLAQPGVVERFVTDPAAVARIRSTFAGLYSLDMNEEGDRTVALAMADPHRFVLKPEREGGGNNIFGDDITELLGRIGHSPERKAYILMDKVRPLAVRNVLVRSGFPLAPLDCVSELGMFGIYVRQGGAMVLNDCGGHLLRTKSLEHADGGVAAGVAVLDNPRLV
ncbi:glutathione synthetase isoform X1 [Petromyzon marinus]|uniref:Glutathione synthetase n=2 Tax=Petromyzon marinus TaxID=7757 RepID=A0AAJ7U1U0_PETMA|nr:glutathione synthetase isoform X1 [Petromyzon marinus]XP_032827102.1 glutathione synthetase isoform X1 [Petromyzon marinus]